MISELIIRKATGQYAYDEQLVNMVVNCVRYSENHFIATRAKWPRLYDLWRGTWSGRFHPHKNNVHIPLIFSALWAFAARIAASSLSSYPPVSFMGYGPDDQKIARKQEALNAAQFKDDKGFLKQTDLCLAAALYGVGIVQVGWKRDEQERIIEQIDRMPLSGRTVQHIRKGKVVMFDGPESVNIDLLDFFPQPAHARMETMRWVVRRYFLDLDDVRYMASVGTFSQEKLDLLEKESIYGGTNVLMMSVRRFAARTAVDDDTARFMDQYSRPIEILEFWGRVPSELSPDGVLERVISVANRRYVLRNRPNPYNHGVKPFLAYSPTPDPHYFYAPGKAEVVEKLQIVGNRYLNQSLDAADLMIDPMWFYDRSSGLVTRNLYSRPGRFIPLNGNPNNLIMQMQANAQGLTVADNKVAQVREFLQMGTGIVDDAVQGFGGDQRQTAREFIGRREAAGTRLMLEARIYEETMLEPLANMFAALSKQFLAPPVEVLILGDGASIDDLTGLPIPSSRETLSGYDLLPSYQARALGATMGLSKQMQQQNVLQLLQALATPLGQSLMGQINAINFFRSIFKIFEVPNINEVFTTNSALQQMVMRAQGLSGGAINDVSQVPTSGQISNGGPSVIPGMPGAARSGAGSPAGLLQPPDLKSVLPPVGMAA